MPVRKYAARTDANHGEIRTALRQLGCYVVDLSRAGGGVPDLLVGFRGTWFLIEAKDGSKPPSKRTLTNEQALLIAEAQRVGCKVTVATTVDEALAAVGARRAA